MAEPTVIVLTTSQTWSRPADWQDAGARVDCYGGGGDGTGPVAGGGGGGGAHTYNDSFACPSSVSVVIGSRTDTEFGTICKAVAGANCVGRTGGAGGAASACVPAANAHSGGKGGDGVLGAAVGGGGGCGGRHENGHDGASNTAPAAGGAGGDGSYSPAYAGSGGRGIIGGEDGLAYGGGGGGGAGAGAGGGAPGVVVISYYPVEPAPILGQSHFRCYADDAALNAATPLAAEDTDITVDAGDSVRLRILTANTGDATSNLQARLEYSEDEGSWTQVPTSGGKVRVEPSAHFADGDATTARLTAIGTFVAGDGKDIAAQADALSVPASRYTEHEWCIRFGHFSSGHSYRFRETNAGTDFDTYGAITEIAVSEAALATTGLEVRLYDGPYPAGLRKYFPNQLLAGVSWELIRGGYYGEATITLTDEIDSAIAPTGGDRVEIWLDGVLRYRGNVGTPERSLDVPESKTITCYGLADRLNSILVNGGYGKHYLYPGGGDVSLIAADLLSSYIGPIIPNLESDIQPIGFDVETVPLSGACREAFDTLIEQSANQAVWGFEVNPDTGADRFFFRPLDTTVRWKQQIGGRVRSYRHSPDYSGIRNAVHLTGGEAKYPNLLPNSSFEAPVVTEASNGNLLQNPGFEDGNDHWTIHDGDIVISHGIRTGKKACDMDGAGAYVRQSGIAVTAGTLYTFEVWLRAPDENADYHLVITPNAGGSATPYPDTGSYTVLQGEHFKQRLADYTAPAGCTSITVEVVDDSGHIHVDDLAVYATNDVRQEGWVVETDSAVTKVEQNWAWPTAWHGSTAVRLKPTWFDTDGWVRFKQQVGSEISLEEEDNFQFSIYAYNPGAASVTVKLYLYVTESDGNHRTEYSDPLTVPAGGDDWTQLVFAATGWTAEKGDQSVLVGVEIETLCELWFDAAFFGPYDPDNPNSIYLFESKVVYDLSTDDAWVQAHTGIPQAVKDSITTYGRREAEESVESITDLTSAQNWARGYFGINALPITPHVIEIAGADDVDIEPDGKLELLGQEIIESAQVVRVAYSIAGDGLLTASVDLNTERPTFEGLLTRMQKEAARKAKGTTASGGNSATGGSGSAGHSRLHAFDSADDHEAAEAADYGKFAKANASTGVAEWANIAASDVPAPGSDTQILYNDGGALASAPGLTYAKATGVVTFANGLQANGGLVVSNAAAALAASAGLLDVVRETANVDAALTAVRLRFRSTGTPAAGIGVAFSLRAENSAGQDANLGYYACRNLDPTDGSERGELVLSPDWHDSQTVSATRAVRIRATSATIADLLMPLDDARIYWGTGLDASIRYDGTNMIVNPREVGTGNLLVEAGIGLLETGASPTYHTILKSGALTVDADMTLTFPTGLAASPGGFLFFSNTGTGSFKTQQAHIGDANVDLSDIVAKFNSLLSALETFGILASS